MGLLSLLRKIFSSQSPTPKAPISTHSPSAKKLTYAEKELLAVQRTTQDDVQQLNGFPYTWNRSIEKFIKPNEHPFVYMDIVGDNLAIAKAEIAKMNDCIERDKKLSSALRKIRCLPISEMIFKRSADTGYSRLILNPVAYDGKPSKYPVTLFFMSDPWNSNYHGSIFYGQDGTIQKAEIFIGHGSYFLYYEVYEGDLALVRAEDVSRTIIYKGKRLLDHEANLEKTEKDYEWIQANLPDKCPKSISSYRRMKTQNTKNYQLLKQLAANHGRDI
ncbi:MAG: hypothetical protein IKC95_02315 [Oscillospiraceae bacterium]|nr:hypothetical protein [Oscillospiraceae bacterium]